MLEPLKHVLKIESQNIVREANGKNNNKIRPDRQIEHTRKKIKKREHLNLFSIITGYQGRVKPPKWHSWRNGLQLTGQTRRLS